MQLKKPILPEGLWFFGKKESEFFFQEGNFAMIDGNLKAGCLVILVDEVKQSNGEKSLYDNQTSFETLL